MNQFRLAGFWSVCSFLCLCMTMPVQLSWTQMQGWSEEKQLVQAGTIEDRVTTPAIAVSGNNVYIAFRQKQIKIIRSSDLGKTWSEPVEVSKGQTINNYPAIAVFDSKVVVVWSSFIKVESGLNTLQLFYSESSNRGIDWSDPKRLTQTRELALKPMFLQTGDSALLTWLETPLPETLGNISAEATTAISPETIDQLFEPGSLSQSLNAQRKQVRTKFYVSTYTPRSGQFSPPVAQPDENFGSAMPRVYTLFGPVNNKLYLALNTNTEIKLYESSDQGQDWKRSFDESTFFDARFLVDLKIINGKREGVMAKADITAYQTSPIEFFKDDSLNNKVQLSPPHYVRSVPKFEMKDNVYHVVWEAGNQDQSHITYMRTDNIPPTSTMVQPADPNVKESQITFGWKGEDNISYTERLMYSYSIEENQWSQPQAQTTVALDAPADGDYTFKVRAEDVAGNIQNPVTEFKYNTFQSAPDCEMTNPPAAGQVIASRSVKIPFSTKDNSDSAAQITYSAQVDDGEWSEFHSGSEHTFTNLSNGEHILRIRTKDSRGNIDPTPALCRVNVSVGLELVLENVPALNTNEQQLSFSWSAKDDTGKVVQLQCYYTLNGQAAQNTTSPTTLDLTDLEEGRHIVKIWGVDPSGDKTGEVEHQWIIDRTPPETTAAFKREYSAGKALIELNANDPNLGGDVQTLVPTKYEYSIAEGEWIEFEHHGGNWVTYQPLPFYAWGYIVNIRAVDRAGNVDASPVTVDLRIFTRTNPLIFYPVVVVLILLILFIIKSLIPARGGSVKRKPVAAATSASSFDSDMESGNPVEEPPKTSSFSMDDDDEDDPYK